MSMITDVNNFDASKVCFLEHEERTMEGGSVQFKCVPIRITMSYGSKRPLFFVTDECFSWGLQEQSGYKLPIVMTNRLKSGEVVPTEHQNNFLKAFEFVVEECRQHCLSNREKLGRCYFESSELRKMGNCLCFRKEVRGGEQFPIGPPINALRKVSGFKNFKKAIQGYYKNY